ncbi:MAG: UDP-N-acetylglucosamine 2-epimerase (non-hydrolyzing) [Ectothiorhodospiraceae bacterium]|nr:UDP-N-acetylglucosamine 2-epimerase (non-hydrolyzing) [Ectothiorhodospiraceae bacterium]
MTHVLVTFGTRPEAIKLAPVIKHIQSKPEDFRLTVCITSQHKELLRQVIDFFGITEDVDLDVMVQNQTLEHVTTAVLNGMREVLLEKKPDIVLVQGDTTTVFASALAAYYQKIAVGHVEAGLRTHNKYSPFPEEINRKLTGGLTDLHFAPTKLSAENLIQENYPKADVYVTGNTVIDAVLLGKSILDARSDAERKDMIASAGISPEVYARIRAGERRLILVTAHRRESFGEPFRRMCFAMKQLIDRNPDIEIIYPVHPNPQVRNVVFDVLKDIDRVHLIDPVPYEQLVLLMDMSYLLLTDSGGIQEEGPSLQKPVLVMRETTERPEGIEAGVSRLVGTDREKIISTVEELLHDEAVYEKMAKSANPYGDGKASVRIADILQERLPLR